MRTRRSAPLLGGVGGGLLLKEPLLAMLDSRLRSEYLHLTDNSLFSSRTRVVREVIWLLRNCETGFRAPSMIRPLMSGVNGSSASLRVFGDELLPEDITARLGAMPSESYRKGDVKRTRSGREVVRKTGMWLLDVQDKEPEDPDSQIVELFSRLTPELAVWKMLSAQYKIDICCGLFMEKSSAWLRLQGSTLLLLAERGIEMTLDVYGPVHEISPENPCPCGSGRAYRECCAPEPAT